MPILRMRGQEWRFGLSSGFLASQSERPERARRARPEPLLLGGGMSDDHWSPPNRSWPTRAEVREVVRIILDNIEKSPDWTPKPKPPIDIQPPDETWNGWGRRENV